MCIYSQCGQPTEDGTYYCRFHMGDAPATPAWPVADVPEAKGTVEAVSSGAFAPVTAQWCQQQMDALVGARPPSPVRASSAPVVQGKRKMLFPSFNLQPLGRVERDHLLENPLKFVDSLRAEIARLSVENATLKVRIEQLENEDCDDF